MHKNTHIWKLYLNKNYKYFIKRKDKHQDMVLFLNYFTKGIKYYIHIQIPVNTSKNTYICISLFKQKP